MLKTVDKKALDDTNEIGLGQEGDKFVTPDIFRKYLLITDSAFKKQESIDKIAVALPNVKIRKSFLNASDSNSPAKFSWVYDFKEDDSFYIFDGGISYYKEFENFYVAPTLEAHLASKDGSERDSMSARLAVEGYPFSDNNHYINFSPVYETDRRLETETVGADLWYSYANGRGGWARVNA